MKKIVFVVGFCLCLFTCEKDDICQEGAAITPRLIVTFYDNSEPELKKDAENFLLYGVLDNGDILYFETQTPRATDSINVPLKTYANLTKLYFHKDINTSAENILDTGNKDAVDVNYTRQEIYISRACGFIYHYTDLNPELIEDDDNWILDIETTNTTIENETASHVKIYH